MALPKLRKIETPSGATGEVSSGSVFADLGFPDAEEMDLKSTLGLRIARLIKSRGLTQAAAAKAIGGHQPDVSNILRARLDAFSTDRLLMFLSALGQDVKVILPRPRKKGPGHITIEAR